MRISFDLDDTLIPYHPLVPTEAKPLPILPRFVEPLRLGTRNMFSTLRSHGWQVGVYSASFRSRLHIRAMFFAYRIRLSFIINQPLHVKMIESQEITTPLSKHPGLFNIDLHVDDSEQVLMDGDKHGFEVVLVKRDDPDWCESVMAAAARIENRPLNSKNAPGGGSLH